MGKKFLSLLIAFSLVSNNVIYVYLPYNNYDALRPVSTACRSIVKRDRTVLPKGGNAEEVFDRLRLYTSLAEHGYRIPRPKKARIQDSGLHLDYIYGRLIGGEIDIETAQAFVIIEVLPAVIHEKAKFVNIQTVLDILSLPSHGDPQEAKDEFIKGAIDILERHKNAKDQALFKNELAKLILEGKVFNLFWISRALYLKIKKSLAALKRDIREGNDLTKTPLYLWGDEANLINAYRSEITPLYSLMYLWHKMYKADFGATENAFFSWIQLFDDDATHKAFIDTEIGVIQLLIARKRPIPQELLKSLDRVLRKCERELSAAGLILLNDEVMKKWDYFDENSQSNYPIATKKLNSGKGIRLKEVTERLRERFTKASADNERQISDFEKMPEITAIRREAASKLEKQDDYKIRVKRTGFELSSSRTKREKIVERNKQYLGELGWLESVESLPYKRLFILEDEKLPEFIEAVAREEEWCVGITRLLQAPTQIRDTSRVEKTKREKALKSMGENIVSLAHLMQSIYFYSRGQNRKAEDAYIRARLTSKKGGIFWMFRRTSLSDPFYDLADRVYKTAGFDHVRARYLFELGLKLYDIRFQNHYNPSDYAEELAKLDLMSTARKGGIEIGKTGLYNIKPYLYICNTHLAKIYKMLSLSDIPVGDDLNWHFKNMKEETMRASKLVEKPGTAVVFGSGSFLTLPIAEMLKERCSDGRLKYKKIILIDLAEGLSEKALDRLLKYRTISKEDRKRIRVVNADVTNAMSNILFLIDLFMIRATRSKSHKDWKFPYKDVSNVLKHLSDPKKFACHLLPAHERILKDESADFVVFTMALGDFTRPIEDYLKLWLSRFPEGIITNLANTGKGMCVRL